MPNPLDTLYDQLKGQYPDLVDRSEFIGKLSNEDELKKLHDAASKDIPGFVDFDNFKSKVGESLSTYDQDSDYKAQSAPAEQESAPTDVTIPRREKGRHVPSKPQKDGIDSEAYVPAQPGQPIDTHVDAEAFDRETGDLDELDRRYQEKVKRLEGYGVDQGLYVNEEEARKHYEAYSRLYNEAEQDRLVYNRRVKAADDERAEQQRQLDLQSKDRKTRRTAEYGGYTNDQVRKEQERLKKERAYLEDPKSKRNADYSKRVMEYNADQTALSGEADKRNKRAESKRAMYNEVNKLANDPDVQKRITGNDTTAYVLSGNNPYALQNYDAARERAKTMSDEELVDACKTIAGQKYARGDNKDIYAPLASLFMAYHNELMYRLGGDEPKSALEMRYDMIDKVTESSPEGDNFMLTLRNYLDGTAGMGTANFENDQSERANIPQFAVVDNFNALLAQKEAENKENVERIAHYPDADDFKGMEMARAALDINYDAMLEQAFERFGNENLKAYITAYALRNGVSIDEAARRVNQSIWNETIGKEMEESRPKSNAEFFLRRITSDNMFAKLWQIGLRAQNGTLGSTDPFMVNSTVLDEYAKDHPGWDTAAVVTNFAVMEGPIFSAYGKAASGLVGAGERAIIGAATKTAEKTAIESSVKALNQSFWYRLAKGVPTGGLVGFQYGTMSGAIDQAYYDGNVNFGKVIAGGLHMGRDFAIMHGVGEVFGVTGDAILRRGQRAFRNGQGKFLNRLETASLDFLNNVAKTTTNAAVVTGLYAAIDKPALERENKKIAAENARLPEDQRKPLNQIASVEDTFYSSLRMFAGLDAVGTLRRAWSIGVRGDYERNKHVKIHFDKFDKEALEKAFGKNPNSLLRQIVFGNVDGIPAKWFEIDPEAEAAIYQELGRELTPAEKEAYATYGFTELRKVILNKDIPWATRAKIVSVITGRVVQEPPVAKGDFKAEMDSSGTQIKRIIVKSLDLEGNVIQITEFSGKEFEAARRLYESLNDRGWRNNAMLCGDLVIDAIEDKTYADTVDEMAREKGIAPDQFEQMVFGIKQKDITGEKVTYQERQLVDEFDKRHQQKQQAETELAGPNKLFEQVAREVFGAEWKQAKAIPFKSWGEMTEAEKEFVNRYIDRMGAMGVAERNKLMNANPDWARTAKEYEESVRRRMAEAERPAEAEPLPALEDEKVSVETPAEERVEPTPEVIELEEEKPAEPEPVKEEEPSEVQPTQSAGPQDMPTPVEERPTESEPAKEEPVAEEKPDTEGQPQAGTIGFEPVEQPTERERFDAERKAKAATITDADIEANREALGIPEGTALTDEARQIYAEDLAEDLMRYERFKRGESDEKARFHDYWESKFNPKRPKPEKPVEKQEEPVEEEEDEVTDADALIEQFDNLKGRSDLEKYRNALTVFAGDDEIMTILEDLEPHDITEWVSSFLGLDSGKGYSMLWESKTRGGNVIAKGFKEETGWSWNDAKGFAFMFDNKNGMSPRRVAEKIWESLPSGMKDQYSDVDVFDIMMDLFKSSSRKSDLTGYIRNNRMEQVRKLLNRRRNDELAAIARYKERMRRGDEEPVPEPAVPDEGSEEFAVREDDIAPFSLLSLNYRKGEVEGGTIRSRARTRKQIGTIAKALGYKIRWVADKSYNAKIDTDEKVLYLNIRTDQPLAAVMGHEVTHDLRKSDPEAYETLKRYAKDLLGQEQWDNEVKDVTDVYNEEYKRRGWEPIRADKAEEEVVCDTMGKLLHSRKGLRELAGSLDPGVAGKVYRLMKKITDTIKHALDEIGDVTDPDYRKPDYSTMDAALQEFLEAVKQRAKNTQDTNKQGIHRDPSGGYSVTDKAEIESLAPRMEGESEAAYNERIAEIGADENAFVDGDGQFSLKREDTMRDNSVKYFEEYHVRGNKDRKYGPLRRNSITRQALDKANEMIAEMRDYIAPWYDRETGGNRYLPEEVYGLSTIFDNASYGATLENTLICTRTLAYNDFCDSVKRKLGRPLTKRESFLASQMLYDIATDPQCLYCYVSLDRKAYDEYLLRYFDERDAVIERYNKMADKSAENIDALYTTFLDGRKDTYQMRSRFNSWLQLADHDSAIGRDKVALSSDRKNALAQESDEEAAVRWRDITKQYNRLRGEEKKQFKQSKEYLDALHAYLATEQGQIKDACAYAQGASWAKKEAEYRSYTGELLRTTKRMLGGLASHYGLRFYSFSEYSPAFILENMQMIRDAALRGLKGFAYTKEIDFCKIFLPTGININCSTYGRRNAAGEIVMDERQGANWDEARALRDQYENMGIVFVATDDEMVRWAKEQPWIDVIIPFHIVRTGADIAEFYGWTNYTNVSADYDAQGRHKDIMPPEHNNSIEDYDRLVAERGLTRRFPQFYDGPGDQNYMKLINETRRKASDTPILTPVFNMEEAKKSFDKFVEKGGYWGGFYEVGADDVVRAVDEVAADIEAGKSAGEVEYGRQDIDFDSAMANLEKTRRRINRNREHGNTPKTSFSLKRDDRYVPTFYSNAAKAVEGVKQNKATAEQWKAMLTKAGGIKAGEDKWMGLSQWLDEHKGQTLTKEEVAQFVADNGIQMEEVEYVEGGNINFIRRQFPEWDDAFEVSEEFGGPSVSVLNDIKAAELYNKANPNDRVELRTGSRGDTFLLYEDQDKVIDWANSLLQERMPINSTRYRYTTDGLENKREIAFVVPGVQPYQEGDEIHFGADTGGKAIMWVRFGETTDESGEPVLVIDEIQSNRHQDAREKGYQDEDELKSLRQRQHSLIVEKRKIVEDILHHQGYRHWYETSDTGLELDIDIIDKAEAGRLGFQEQESRIKEINEELDDIKDAKDRIKKLVPEAPFERNWHEVAMKRMLRLAAEGGYAKLAWTTGKQQAERYGLRTIVDYIEREDDAEVPNAKGFVLRERDGGESALYVDDNGIVVDSTLPVQDGFGVGMKLSDIVGNEIADKMMQLDNGNRLEDRDLDLGGGEGMKGFYDQILPRFMDKYGKRWGVKTGEVELPKPFEADHDAPLMWHSVDINEDMRRSVVEQGQPLFSLKRKTYTDADGNEVYTETREDGTKDREITTYGDGSKKALWYDDAGVLKERLDYYPNGEVSQVANYDYAGELTRHIQYDENRRITSYYLPAIGTDWSLDENGIARGKSNGVEIKPYNFQFSLKRNTAELDKEYVDAIKRGDEQRAVEMLLNKALSAVGITPYIAPHGYGGSHRDIAKRLKTNEGNAVVRAVADMQRFIPDNAVLVPMPPHDGEVTEETDTMILADALSVITGKPVVVALEGEPRESRYAAKAAGRPGITAEEMGFSKIADIPEGKVPIIIDNVVGTGETAKAAVNALGGGITLAYAKATRSKATQGLKNATITYDDKGNIIPLSERFDAANSDVNYSLKRRRNRDDYTDEDRADAAIIANTYLAQADALRQQIEADRQREHQLVEERNRLLALDYPAADPADRPAIMDRINDLRNQINDLRNANYENNTKLRSMDYEYRVAKEILEQGAVTDEEAARFDAGQMTREEKVLEQLFKAAADSRADKKAKQKAIRGLVRELVAITDNFKAAMKARGIESQRKHYDKGTVDHIIRLAKAMMGTGYIDNMTSYEVKRLMGMINNAATRESIEEQAGRIVDMMLDHQIRTLRNDFDKQLRVTGQKTNSSGVQVQAGLDQEGQVVMEAMRKSMNIIADSAGERYDSNGNITEWGEFYEKTLNDMGDADPVKAEQARKIFEGVWLASKWYEDVRTMEINGRILRSQMEDFKASNKPAKDADADTKQRYNDVLADYQEMLRQNKINIIEAYERMTSDVGMTQAESIRRAKEFADAQKQRVNEIQHNANSDLTDVDDNTQVETPESRVFGANKNNVLARLLFASAGTYEKFMRFFGRMAPNGEGYLFKRFMTQYHHARQDYWNGRHSAFEEMDKKMAEVFGKKKMHWSDIYEMTRDHKKFPPITVSYWDGYRNGQPYLRVDELNQSEALYLYMINKMPDGRMKLRHMGITDDVVQQMAGQINNKLIQLADWLQSEFLPKMRIKYNETHKRVFGADMAAIEDYFPLRINKLAVASDMDITERDMNDNKPSTITGAIVKRRVNTLPIDLHTDAFDVALSHIDEMEHWSAFAEFNRDNNTLVNYKRFRTKVNNMRSLELGAGNVLWKNFTDAVAIAADAYHPRAGSRSGDHYSTRVAKFVSTAKIALRPYTALKQLLSIPAFWADSDPLEQMKATVNVANTWQWAIDNLPGFAERWQSRQAGNIKLANYNDLSGLRRRKTMRKLQRAGMWANAAIDGLACAMGGKAVYETKLKRYRKMGYDEAVAQEKALIDAAIAYNNSQQSSEGAYVSPLQVDRTWFANAFSVFRSASMGYTRRLNTSLRQLRNATFKPGYGTQSVEFLKKQMMRDGLTEEQATKWAHRIYRRANLKAAASVAIFGQILPFAWNLGANMFYLLFGKDDKEKEGILADSFRHSFFGPIEGLTGGNVLSELGDIAADTAIGKIWGDGIWGDSEAYKTLGYRDFSTMPLSSDLRNLLKYFARDEVKAANEVVNILFQVATGVNPQTITDWATAILDFSRSDMERRDIAMFAMRLLSTPQSQLDKFYLDQMNLSQEQASKMSVDDLIKRYATYKRWRETPLTGWMYSDEREKEVEKKFQKRYEQMLEERSVAEDGLRGTINDIKDLPRKRTMMQKLQKELTDSIEAADPELYKKALEGEKADDDEYVRHVTDKDVEQMAELTMKKKALRAARDRKVKADKDAEAGRITQEEYDAIYKECAHQWKLYNYLNNTLPKKLKEWKLKMEPDMQDKYTPEQVMDTIRAKTDKALQMRPEDMKLKKGDKKKVKKNKKK